jgi:hypothetical protein
MEYREHLAAYIDLLGFSEANDELDESTRREVHALLLSLANMRSNFAVTVEPRSEGDTTYYVQPAISTFSDNIAISFDLETLRSNAHQNNIERVLAFLTFPNFTRLVSTIAGLALRQGFLIRGAATVGRLHHTSNVIFGEALVQAVRLEKTAVYPRVILSSSAMSTLSPNTHDVMREDDGIYCLNYIPEMIHGMGKVGPSWGIEIKQWLGDVVPIIQSALEKHEKSGSLNKLAKWTWFARRFRAAVEAFSPLDVNAFDFSAKDIPWK